MYILMVYKPRLGDKLRHTIEKGSEEVSRESVES